jgi:hypothetical protein
MRELCIVFLSAVICAGCRSGASEAPATAGASFDPFPVMAPVADADPSTRTPVTVGIPVTMRVVRRGESLLVSFPTVQSTNLTLGHKLVTGFRREDTLYCDGTARPLGMSLQGGLLFESSTNVLPFKIGTLPTMGREFTLEHRVTIFETDMPVQHMWSPQSGKHYGVLWARTFRETVR